MPDSFQERYEIAVEYLFGSLPPGSGMSERSIATAEKWFGVQLPTALRDYYTGIGNLRRLNCVHDRLLAPNDWFLDGGKLAFMVENQAVVYWGVESVESPDDDPPVFQGINNLPQTIEWNAEHDRCSEFLLVMLHWQAACGGLECLGMADIGQEVAKHFERQWHPVGKQEGIAAFRLAGRAACIIGEGDAKQLHVGTNCQQLFAQVREELDAVGVALDRL